jgi:hypothetical protein
MNLQNASLPAPASDYAANPPPCHIHLAGRYLVILIVPGYAVIYLPDPYAGAFPQADDIWALA